MKKTFEEISKAMVELSEYVRLKKELEVQVEALQDEIKEYMDSEGLEELLGEGGQKAYYKTVVSNRLDTTSLKKSEYKNIYEMFLKQSETKPFKFYA